MRLKRFSAALLAAAALTSALPAADATPAFSDLSTLPEVAEAAEFLRLMGVVNGLPDGEFHPEGTLSRAEFCAMAIRALNREDEEPAQRNRTIYLDVGPSFWATGYINLASIIYPNSEDKGTPLVSGTGDGTFQPNRAITYGEAVTILCRMLGYGTGDVSTGGAWYEGYLAAATAMGLTDGVNRDGTEPITRGDAAILFYNLYFTDVKSGKSTYLVSMGGKESEIGILLDTDTTLNDSPAVKTTTGTYKTDRDWDPALEGLEGKGYFDADEKLVAFTPKANTTQRVVNITSALATSMTISGNEKMTIAPDTVVYQGSDKTVWSQVWKDLASSTVATLHYDSAGKLARIYIADADEEVETMVLRTAFNGTGNPFAALAGGGSYTMLKNGLEITGEDIRQYDVATFDANARVIQVSDLKLTGIYEDASPSPDSPTSITFMGAEFPLLSTAWNDFHSFQVGDKVTLLLTADGKVAGAVSPDEVKGDAVGVVSVDGTTAEVTLIPSGFQVKGTVSDSVAKRYDGQLVNVSSSSRGRLSLSAVSGSAAKADLKVSARKLGDREIAENVVVYDRVENGEAVQVEYEDITQSVVSRDKISFVSYDYMGRVRCLVLDDVTGDAYQYGYFFYEEGEEGSPDTLCVKQGSTKGNTYSEKGTFTGSIRSNVPGGVAFARKTNSSSSNYPYRVTATVTLQALTGVKRTAFDPDEMTVTVAGVVYPVSKDVQCYNKTTKTWFASGKEGMEAARAYSDKLTLYYDKAPAEGGKIRMIVVTK